MADHFENNPDQFSDYVTLLNMVHPSKKSESTVFQLLKARGNYTCFAPTNDAVRFYLDSLYQDGLLPTNSIDVLRDSIHYAQEIVFNSIIDHGNNLAYASTDFNEGALNKTNMNDRYVNITYGNDSVTMQTVIYVNARSTVMEKDIEVENGYIHTINKVLSPSTATVADLVITTENTSFFGKLLLETGLEKKLLAYKDEVYDDNEKAGTPRDNSGASGWAGSYPEHRYFGFTIFCETDSVFQANGIETIDDLMHYIKERAFYDDDTSYGDDYTDPKNALYQFVAYHILPERLIWNRMVIFSNEKGYSNSAPNDDCKHVINVWEYYETLDPNRRSMKITGIRNGKRINRHATYNLNTYKEKDGTVDFPGVNIRSNNGKFDNNAMNGYYYPIDDILLWTRDVPYRILNERMRYNICALLPEMMTNNQRRDRTQAWYYTPDYFSADNGGSGAIPYMSEGTDFAYLSNYQNEGSASTWTDFQCDEFNIRGQYDFVMKLPPVPYTGTYEIRYGVNANNNRGMAQIYIGTNPNNLPAVGIPIDLRILGTNASIGWRSDTDLGTAEAVEENDKAMRNVDYMKGPKYFYPASGSSGRDCSCATRRIIFRDQLEAGKTYYIRFKSVLESTSTQFFYDYLEIVPKTIYGGDEPEDKW